MINNKPVQLQNDELLYNVKSYRLKTEKDTEIERFVDTLKILTCFIIKNNGNSLPKASFSLLAEKISFLVSEDACLIYPVLHCQKIKNLYFNFACKVYNYDADNYKLKKYQFLYIPYNDKSNLKKFPHYADIEKYKYFDQPYMPIIQENLYKYLLSCSEEEINFLCLCVEKESFAKL